MKRPAPLVDLVFGALVMGLVLALALFVGLLVACGLVEAMRVVS